MVKQTRLAFALTLATCTTLGCTFDSLLDVDDPDIIAPDDLLDRAGAEAFYVGAIFDFAVAKDGSALLFDRSIIAAGGLLSDELIYAGQDPRFLALDARRARTAGPLDLAYLNLHRARSGAERGAAAMADLLGADPRIGELNAIVGAVHVLLGEHFCSGVPFSTAGEVGEIAYGTPLSTDEIFEGALTWLDRALTNAIDASGVADANVQNLARVLRGRSLLNLARYADAAAAVLAVPTGFEYRTYHSATTGRTINGLFFTNQRRLSISVGDSEGLNGLDFATAGDPRLPTSFEDTVGLTPMYFNLNWDSESASVVTASGIEARLIEAEALLQANDATGWLDALNAARATISLPLPPLADPGSLDARVDLLFRERAFWMFGTGHRLGDLRRLVRHYGRDPETVFPTGLYHVGGIPRGTNTTIAVPDTERNNPNFSGCLSDAA